MYVFAISPPSYVMTKLCKVITEPVDELNDEQVCKSNALMSIP